LAEYLSGQTHPRPKGRGFWPRKYKEKMRDKDSVLIGQLLISEGVITPAQLEIGLSEGKKPGILSAQPWLN